MDNYLIYKENIFLFSGEEKGTGKNRKRKKKEFRKKRGKKSQINTWIFTRNHNFQIIFRQNRQIVGPNFVVQLNLTRQNS